MKSKLLLPLIALATATTVFGASFQLEQICNGSGALTATETEIAKKFPIGDCNALGKSRGGNLDDIDAINDGSGSIVLSPVGQNISSTQAKMRNTKFIEAVREHGSKAKDGSKGVVDYLNDNSIDTEALVREADAKDGELSSEPTLTDTYATATIVSEAFPKLAPMHTMNVADMINGLTHKGTVANWTGIHTAKASDYVEDVVYFGGKTVRVGNLVTGRHTYFENNGAVYYTNGFEIYSSEDGESWKLEYSVGDSNADSYTHVMNFDTKYLKFKSTNKASDGYWRLYKNTLRDYNYTAEAPLPRWDIKEYSD